jgi:hypothetical protein
MTSTLKILGNISNSNHRAGGVVQVIEHKPSKHEALIPNPNATKKMKGKFKLSQSWNLQLLEVNSFVLFVDCEG